MNATLLVRIIEDANGPTFGLDRVTLDYDPGDPLAVLLTFDPQTCPDIDGDGEPPAWRLDRGLLAEGGGIPGADLAVERSGEWVTVTLASPEGRCKMRLPRAGLDRFLADTFDAVPLGDEALDIDALIGALVGGGS